ncbi:MAG: general secretion pathway protein G [Maribacter sp.]|jgi:general secretion pathway protein G
MPDLIAFILEIYLDIKHWFKVKNRRRFEKGNSLPKSIVWHPLTKPLFLFFILFIISFSIFSVFSLRNKSEEKTKEKIIEISAILAIENKQLNKYPKELKDIIRNNPLRKNITLDYWNTEFVYVVSKDSLNYTIISLGKDRLLNTSDDLKTTN